jgi:hypothetical protein
VLGPVAYLLQLRIPVLTEPWYLPMAGTVAAILLLIAVLRRRGLWRILGLVFCGLLAGFEWMFLLGLALPAYTGPVASGQPFPAFATLRADGTPFTQDDLRGEQNTVLVFFRGRW